MAEETEWSCPICCDAQTDIASVVPCSHRFCLGCILRWADRKPECPLCRGPIEIVRFSVREEDSLQCVILPADGSPDASSQAGGAPGRPGEISRHRPTASPPSSPQGRLSPAEQGDEGRGAGATVGGLSPEVWARLFQRREHLLDPVLPWLRRQLQTIYGAQWWLAKSAESTILCSLCIYGPNEEVLVPVLQDSLEEYAALLIRGVIITIACECSEEAWRLLHSGAAGEEDVSPAASSSSTSPSRSREGTSDSGTASSSSPAGPSWEEEGGRPEAALREGPGHPPPAPIPAEQEEPQEEPGEAAAAGPSAQRCSCSPSAPGQDRDRPSGGPRRAPKQRAPSHEDSPQPRKRPRRRH